jgi:hypothetical protein
MLVLKEGAGRARICDEWRKYGWLPAGNFPFLVCESKVLQLENLLYSLPQNGRLILVFFFFLIPYWVIQVYLYSLFSRALWMIRRRERREIWEKFESKKRLMIEMWHLNLTCHEQLCKSSHSNACEWTPCLWNRKKKSGAVSSMCLGIEHAG